LDPRYATGRPTAPYPSSPPARRAGGCNRCCCGCAAAAFVGGLLFFGISLGLALSKPRVDPGTRDRRQQAERLWQSQSPEASRATAARAVERARTVRRQVAEQASAGKLAPFELTVSEDEVNALIASDERVRDAMRSQGVRDVTVLFEERRMLLAGQVSRGGFTFDVAADAVPVVRPDGTIDIRIENARAGRFPVPAALVDEARSALAQVLAKQDPERGRVEEVSLTRGKLTIRGRAEGDVPDLGAAASR
jgi:hypothetical protein